MKGKFKLIALPFIMAALSLGGMVGGTLAYFTSASSATVTIEAGKVRVSMAIDNASLKAYTVDSDGDNTTYSDTSVEASSVSFENGGSAVWTDATHLALNKLTPGDKVTFNVTITNASNVNIKFRITKSFLARDADGKVKGHNPNTESTSGDKYLSEDGVLNISATLGESSYTLQDVNAVSPTFSPEWTPADATTKTLAITIVMPTSVGNDLQGAKDILTFGIEAVQANGTYSA